MSRPRLCAPQAPPPDSGHAPAQDALLRSTLLGLASPDPPLQSPLPRLIPVPSPKSFRRRPRHRRPHLPRPRPACHSQAPPHRPHPLGPAPHRAPPHRPHPAGPRRQVPPRCQPRVRACAVAAGAVGSRARTAGDRWGHSFSGLLRGPGCRPPPGLGPPGPRMEAAAEPGIRSWLGGGSPRRGSPASSPDLGSRGRARPGPGPGPGSGSGSGLERAGARTPGSAALGHSFRKVTLTKPTFCHLCSDFIWGLAGFLCDGERARPPCRPQPLARTGTSPVASALPAMAFLGQSPLPLAAGVCRLEPPHGGDEIRLCQGLGGVRWPRPLSQVCLGFLTGVGIRWGMKEVQ